jgi:hypothetical protein
MVRDAEATARNAEAQTTNDPGMCLQWSRTRAEIGAMFPDAATAWKHALDRHKGDTKPPRGSMVYWLGGSHGYGHIAVSLGNGNVRSTDAGGAGKVATRPVAWFEQHWGLPYAGWADNVNDTRIPGVGAEMNDDDWARMESLLAKVWSDKMTVTQPGDGKDVQKARQQVLRELWQKVTRAT